MTPPSRRIGPEDVLRHMEVSGEAGLFVLGCFERRVTLCSQQVRALNLVYALHEEGRMTGEHAQELDQHWAPLLRRSLSGTAVTRIGRRTGSARAG